MVGKPIPVDRPSDEWRKLHETGTTPLAGGENVMGVQGFNSLLSEGVLDVIQPDLAKWGGLTKTIPVAQKYYLPERVIAPLSWRRCWLSCFGSCFGSSGWEWNA